MRSLREAPPSAKRREPRTPPQSITDDPAGGTADADELSSTSFDTSPSDVDDDAVPSGQDGTADNADAETVQNAGSGPSQLTADRNSSQLTADSGLSQSTDAGNTDTDNAAPTADSGTDPSPSSHAAGLLSYAVLPLYTADISIMPLAVDSTSGAAKSASFVIDSFGGTTSGAYQNQFDYMGRYRFNICGNTVVRGKVDSQWGTVLHDDASAESRADFFEKNDTVSYDYPSGTCVTNSSSSILANRGGNPTIKRAFLVTAVTCRLDGREMNAQTNPLSKYGVSLKGPRGGLNRFFPNRIYVSTQPNTSTGGRQVCFFDVTSFVQQQGYGMYTGVNIPFSNRTFYSECTPGETDLVGAWKLIVIEEAPSLPIRKLQLKLGGAPVNKSTLLTASIGGNGLYVVGNATGETLASLDASDPDEAGQMLSYTTSKSPSFTDLYCGSARPANNFFTFKADIDGNQVWQRPGPRTSMRPLSGTSTYFSTCNTDLSLMSINGTNGTMRLTGNETSVILQARMTECDVIVSALGIAADVVTPSFETTLHVSDLTRNWSTSDPGFDKAKYLAVPGDTLRATMISTNTSDQNNLGLANGTVTLTLPAFSSIDRSTVIARFRDQYGRVTNFSNISVSGNKLTVSTSDGLQVRKGSYFEIACQGTAAGGSSPASYTNSCSLSGALVDTTGTTQPSSVIDNLGQATRDTASDGAKFDFTVTASGPGVAGALASAGALPAAGPYASTITPYGTGTGNGAWRPNANAHVAFVAVDGQVRGTLAGGDRVSIPMVGTSHQVHVAFADGPAPGKEDAPYTVETSGDAGIASLTPTTGGLAAGASHTVDWTAAPGYQVAEVKVDGVPLPARSTSTVSFDALTANHKVEVRTAPVPASRLSVKTNVIGPGTITASSTVTAGQNYPVSWSGSVPGAILSYVKVNGATVFDKNLDMPTKAQPRPTATSALPSNIAALFANIQADVSVEVCYLDPNRTPTTPDPFKVTTQIAGGAGSITPTMTVAPGGTARITWKPGNGWVVGGVTVIRGESRATYGPADAALDANGMGIELSNVQSDCLVQVTLTRNQIDIVTAVAGAGGATITPSLIDVPLGSSPHVAWTASPGFRVKAVIVDGVADGGLAAANSVDFPNVQEGHTVTVVTERDGDPDEEEPEEGDLFRVDVTCAGAGTAGPSALVSRGESHHVSWTGIGGALPVSVTVDGAPVPALLGAGGIDFTAISGHHRVHVEFPSPDGEERFTVSARIAGGPGTISGSATYAPGENAEVTWSAAAGWRVKKVTVDGAWDPALANAGRVSFSSIGSDHDVVVELEEDLWRVDVSWDGAGTAGQSATVRAGDSHTVTWTPDAGIAALKVIVDGVERPDLLAAGKVDFSDIRGNHTVHVVFEQDPPDDDLWRRVDVSIVGGPGTCTGSGRVAVGDDHEVTWAPDAGWRVASVAVDGQVMSGLATVGAYTFPAITENHSVMIRLEKADLSGGLSLDTRIVGGAGGASITPSEKNVPAGANRTVAWSAPPGWRVASVTVDGVDRGDLLRKGKADFPAMSHSHSVVVVLEEGEAEPGALWPVDVSFEGAGEAGQSARVPAGTDHLVTWHGDAGARPVSVEVDGVPRPDLLDAGGLPFHTVHAAHRVHVVFPDATDGTPLFRVDAKITGGAGAISGAGSVPAGSDREVTWTTAPGWRVKSVTVDGMEQDPSITRWGFSSVAADHEIVVEVEMALFRVDVTWEGQGTAGPSARVQPGGSAGVTWAPDAGRRVVSVAVDGADRPELVTAGRCDFAAINADHTVHVVFDRDPNVAAWYRVDVEIVGGPGSCTGSGDVAEGADAEATWAPVPGFRVARVTVDGEERPDLLGAGGHLFADVREDHRVLVEIEPAPVEPPGPDEPTPPSPDDPSDPDGPDDPDGSGDPDGGNSGPDSPGTGASEAGDPRGGTGSGFTTALRRLAQTGDPWALLALAAGTVALASGTLLLALRRRRQR